MSTNPSFVKNIRRALGSKKVITTPEARFVYSTDVTKKRGLPACIVFPENTEDIISTVKIASEYKIPVSPRGAGTGMSGGAVPHDGGISISFERMNKILEIDTDNKIAIVEPGVINSRLQEEVAKHNLFYPPDPSSNNISTIAGNIAENAGGLRCVKYGVTSDYVIGLETVNSEGNIFGTGCFAESNDSFDLTQIFCGSEGTLGIISKAVLKLIDKPASTMTLLVEFPSAVNASEAVTDILNAGLIPCIMELIDNTTLKAILEFVPLDLSANTKSVLLIEYDDVPRIIEKNAEKTSEICLDNSALNIKTAADSMEREKLWKLRKSISPSLTRLASGKINEDIAVPRGKIAEIIVFADDLSREIGIIIPIYGHAGDGNLHVNMIFDMDDNKQVQAAHIGVERLLKKVVELDGTISGEHGIGLLKNDYLNLQFSDKKIEFHRRLKRVFDSKNIFNPGKILPV